LSGNAVLWHRLEHSGYLGDLPLWHSLTEEFAQGSVCELGAGTGRITHSLAGAGNRVLAVDSQGELLAALRSGLQPGSCVETLGRGVEELDRGDLVGFPLIIAPMLFVNLVCSALPVGEFFKMIRQACSAEAMIALASVGDLSPFERTDSAQSSEYPQSYVSALLEGPAAGHTLIHTRHLDPTATATSPEFLVPLPTASLAKAASGSFDFVRTERIPHSNLSAGMDVSLFNAC